MAETPDQDPSADIPRGARPHHYLFAREWLRHSFQRRPEMMVLALARATARDEGPRPVIETWRGMGKSLPDEDRIEPDGLDVRTFVDETPEPVYFALIDLPPPLATGEAHTIGLAVVPEDGELSPERDEDEGPRPGTHTAYGLAEATDDGPRLIAVTDDGTQPLEHGIANDPGESLLMALRNWVSDHRPDSQDSQ